MEYERKYKKIKCPACHKENSQWNIKVLEGNGYITFYSNIDCEDVIPAFYEISCPECHYSISDLMLEDLFDIAGTGKVE